MSISFEEFSDRLDNMEGRLAQNVRKAMIMNALRMEGTAKKNATSFPKVVTGRLRNSITGTVVRFQEDEYLILRAGGLTAPNRPFSESADVVYAAIQEFGGGTQRIKPKYYMKRSFERHLHYSKVLLGKATKAALRGEDF